MAAGICPPNPLGSWTQARLLSDAFKQLVLVCHLTCLPNLSRRNCVLKSDCYSEAWKVTFKKSRNVKLRNWNYCLLIYKLLESFSLKRCSLGEGRLSSPVVSTTLFFGTLGFAALSWYLCIYLSKHEYIHTHIYIFIYIHIYLHIYKKSKPGTVTSSCVPHLQHVAQLALSNRC